MCNIIVLCKSVCNLLSSETQKLRAQKICLKVPQGSQVAWPLDNVLQLFAYVFHAVLL